LHGFAHGCPVGDRADHSLLARGEIGDRLQVEETELVVMGRQLAPQRATDDSGSTRDQDGHGFVRSSMLIQCRIPAIQLVSSSFTTIIGLPEVLAVLGAAAAAACRTGWAR
jgi:hypothetical protein